MTVSFGAGGAAPAATVIVCTTRGCERLRRCLTALEAEAARMPVEVVIVLNGADPDVARFADEEVAGATVLTSEENLGFAGGANHARPHAAAPLLILLHDDALLTPGSLAALVAAAERHPGAGIIGPLVLDMDGRVREAGPVVFRDGVSASPARGADPARIVLEPRLTDYCGTSCVLIRASTWDACGGFDERYFPAGYADVDLAFAARRGGWSVRFEPSAVIHHDSGSLPGTFKRWLFARNRDQFVEKWSDDLADHEEFEDGAGALERAVARAARRLPAADAPRALPPRLPAPVGASRRERRLLQAYVAEVEIELAALGDEVLRRDAHLRALSADLDSLNRAAAVDAAEIRRLREREVTLETILAGRWWRLRARLDPLARLVRRSRPGRSPSA